MKIDFGDGARAGDDLRSRPVETDVSRFFLCESSLLRHRRNGRKTLSADCVPGAVLILAMRENVALLAHGCLSSFKGAVVSLSKQAETVCHPDYISEPRISDG